LCRRQLAKNYSKNIQNEIHSKCPELRMKVKTIRKSCSEKIGLESVYVQKLKTGIGLYSRNPNLTILALVPQKRDKSSSLIEKNNLYSIHLFFPIVPKVRIKCYFVVI
jgi:hypothetical protein